MLAKRSHVRFEFTNTKQLAKTLARIEASAICCQQFANLFADCFCAFRTYQLEFANTSLTCEGRFKVYKNGKGQQLKLDTFFNQHPRAEDLACTTALTPETSFGHIILDRMREGMAHLL